jgi:hypothetical protein
MERHRESGAGLPEREFQGLLEILGEVHHSEDLASFRAALLGLGVEHQLAVTLPAPSPRRPRG